MILEICVENLESAVLAQEAGADRIELCRDLSCGGLTPSEEIIKKVRDLISIPIHLLVRPVDGGFHYSERDYDDILSTVELCIKLGIDGVVCGCLLENSEIDFHRMKEILRVSHKLPVTFHRAFDSSTDKHNSVYKLEKIGDP